MVINKEWSIEMTQQFDYTFTCEKCGGTFYSKVNPSGWRHHLCNACSGKQFRDYPVEGTTPQFTPKHVPIKRDIKPTSKPIDKQVFNIDEYIADIIGTYIMISSACKDAGLDIPVENICAWTTGAMIQKGKM